MRALAILLALVVADAALADHHPIDIAPCDYPGNPAGPGHAQNASPATDPSYHLGPLWPGDEFCVGLYLKSDTGAQLSQVMFGLAVPAGIELAPGPSFTPNPDNVALAEALNPPVGQNPLEVYQHTRSLPPGGTPECPECVAEVAVWLVDANFNSPVEAIPFAFAPGIANPNAKLGHINLRVASWAQPGTVTLSGARLWIKAVQPGAVNTYYCGYGAEDRPDLGTTHTHKGCTHDAENPENDFAWAPDEADAGLLTLEVVPAGTPRPKVPATSVRGRRVLVLVFLASAVLCGATWRVKP